MGNESTSRIKIDRLLQEAGWRFFEDEEGPATIFTEYVIPIETAVESKNGTVLKKEYKKADYVLCTDNKRPIVVVEAKREGIRPLSAKDQSRIYAEALNLKYIILSNGSKHYLWDITNGNPVEIEQFPTIDDLRIKRVSQKDPSKIFDEKVTDGYIAISQDSGYIDDPRYKNPETRDQFINESNLRFLRDYQLEAVEKLQDAVKNGKTRFLFEMATGTGKTLVSAAIIKLFLKTLNAERVLFLVDRLELENQAEKNFKNYLSKDFTTLIYKDYKTGWGISDITVTTIQSLMYNDRYKSEFSEGDFDLIISDEAHRCIGEKGRAVFEYFNGYKLGLTATPRDYLKNIENINKKDFRDLERRQLLDTYKTFGCESGVPTYRFSLNEGVRRGYLVSPKVIDARTGVTTQLLSDEGYGVAVVDEDGNFEEKVYFQKDFAKKFFSEDTNRIFCETFMKNAERDPITNEIGKTIIFCASQDHALEITRILNEIAERDFSGKYNSDFAVQVTSNVSEAQKNTINFSNNNLNGHTRFVEGYDSSKTRVCVTVEMMTTGYDCPDLLNLCFMRPVFSPTLFVQMKGRGTRKHTFKHEYRVGNHVKKDEEQKKHFKLFDFFGNCEYFEEKFDYDEVVDLPKPGTSISGNGPSITGGKYEYKDSDQVTYLEEYDVGIDGMRIDRELYRIQEKIKTDPFISQNIELNYEAVEKYLLEDMFKNPDDYYDLERLKDRFQDIEQRPLSFREILHKILGKIARFETKDELLNKEFNKFADLYSPIDELETVKNFFKAYVTDKKVREIIETNDLRGISVCAGLTREEFMKLKNWKKTVPNYIKEHKIIDKYNLKG
ncbi:DEAD/DEAH box helicase family protein [Methanococcus maripaludis]|uniref:Type I restriction enzyme R subunit n=1 Tax=Methanococcus maripaludis TaxID=39152 RepID=A0A7J9PV22_METMI|nr:DEAD/DEAH box helicase family protein [Methanococcus maripaludis]MBA2869447.1 type I restriction enzyme R subunit [Methanococcus maripaludis]